VFGTESSRNQLIYEKCNAPVNFSSFGRISTNSPMHYGVKYEPVSTAIYEHMFNTTVGEFGCIRHERYDFIGASPDGINVDEKSELYGRMLEIKNIVNRDITGIPKREYWVQMQIQMESCNLEECDFFETRFKEYGGYDEFIQDGTFTRTVDDCMKGVVMYFLENTKPLYVYPPIDLTQDEFGAWEAEQMEKHCELTWIKNIYWFLHEYSCVLVVRNYAWFGSVVGEIADMWKIIEHERIHGFEHRAPNKKKRASNYKYKGNPDDADQKFVGCVINLGQDLGGSVQDLGGSVQDLGGSVQDLGGSVQDLGGSVQDLGGSDIDLLDEANDIETNTTISVNTEAMSDALI
jgi:hypothetical protein